MTGAYIAGAQYGFGVEHQRFEFTVKPQLGIAYVDHMTTTLPRKELYQLGAEVNVCYQAFCSGLSYIHMSCGRAIGLCGGGNERIRNSGEDMVAFTAGFRWR